MQASKKIPFEDPNVLMGVRLLYVVSNLIIAGVYFYLKQQIDKKRGKPDFLLLAAACCASQCACDHVLRGERHNANLCASP